jgi:hypothetical protein
MDTICLELNPQNQWATFQRVGQGRTEAEVAPPLFFDLFNSAIAASGGAGAGASGKTFDSPLTTRNVARPASIAAKQCG